MNDTARPGDNVTSLAVAMRLRNDGAWRHLVTLTGSIESTTAEHGQRQKARSAARIRKSIDLEVMPL